MLKLKMLKTTPNELNIGSVFKYEGKIYKIKQKEHIKLSKGGACIKAVCENMLTGNTIKDLRLNVTEKLDLIYVEKQILSYSYSDGDVAVFFNENNEMDEIPLNKLGSFTQVFLSFADLPQFEISRIDHEGELVVLDIKPLSDIITTVKQTNPSIKGESATTSFKKAIVDGDIEVAGVPPHINNGDQIYIKNDQNGFVYSGKR